jgi:hypothetical protein
MKLMAAALLAGAVLTASGLALARSASQQALIDSTVRFLQESQRTSGGFAPAGGKPSQGISAWVAIALEAAGINPQDQARCGADAYSFLVGNFHAGLEEELAWPQIATTAFERELLVVDGAGTDPRDFAGYDLVAEILARQLPDGSFPYVPGGSGEVNDTIFAILALSPLHEAGVEVRIERAAEWVVAEQNEDGGWYYSGKTGESEVDMTGAALQALVVAGSPPSEPQRAAYENAERDGLEYLRRSQLPDGGFPALPRRESESNVASTAWAVQGIWATGGNPEAWTTGPGAREPLDYMESMQQPDGHIRWRASSDLNGIWMTAYVTPAFAGQAWPPPPAPRGDPRASRGEAAACLEAGQGGESPRPGEGVLAGGGGHGAPAFSRPKRQSKGNTPGGARVVRNGTLRPRDHATTRRGANATQPRGTQDVEAKDAKESARAIDSGRAGGAPEVDSAGAGTAAGSAGGPPPDSAHPRRAAAGTPALAVAAEPSQSRESQAGLEEISGAVIGSPGGGNGPLAFGAPGLRSAGAGNGDEDRLGLAIGLAAVLAGLLGAGWQRLREGAAA